MFYTATRKALPMHVLLPPQCPGTGIPAHRRPVEVFLERARPKHMASRLSCIFACTSPQQADVYLDGELGLSTPTVARFLYALEAKAASSAHPMCLVDAVKRSLNDGDTNRADRLAAEYWSPTRKWRFNEYLCTGVTAIDEVQRQSLPLIERTLVRIGFDADKKQALQL